MLGFNINLDLSLFFDDQRKFSIVFVDISKCKNVGDVEKHIKWLFQLENDICLVCDKFLLPKLEDAQLFRQCGTIQVQICDFIDDKNDKKEEENCNNLALNLIQTEKTVDLSCKPKQRLKSNFNKGYCKSSDMSTCYVKNNEITQSFCTDIQPKSHSKDKHKKKKKRNNVESFNEDYNDDTGSDILDMTVNKVQKTSHDNCFLPAEDKILNCGGEHKISMKKHKKRKIQAEFLSEEFNDLTSIELLASDELVSKKNKKSKNNYLDNKDLSQETSHVLDVFYKSEEKRVENKDKRAKHLKCSEENSKTYFGKTRKNCKNLPYEKEEFQLIQNNDHSNVELKNYDLVESVSNSEKCLSERKKLYQNHIDTMLANHTNFSLTHFFPENGVNINSNCVGIGENKNLHDSSSFNNHVDSKNDKQNSQSGEQTVQLNFDHPNTKVKRKRVRKHRKNKKAQYLEAVGPVLQNLAAQNEIGLFKSSTPSTTAKHIYFEDKDCNEEIMADTIISRSLDSTQGLLGANNLNTSQEFTSKECPNWQEELLKLANSPKPIIFQRFGSPKTNLQQTSPHSQDHSLASQSPDKKNQRVQGTSPCTTVNGNVNHESIKSFNIEENFNKDHNHCEDDGAIPLENFKDSVKLTSPDLQNIKLTNYPIIDKVVAEDLILFKLLKLNENYEPDVSNVILAKVKCLTNFPDKLSLEIIEGSGDCELLTRGDASGDETIVQLSWKDLIEPRIFYP